MSPTDANDCASIMAAESRLRRRQRAAAAVGVVAIVEQAGGRTAVVAARVAAALVRVFAILIEGQSQRQIGVQFVVDQLECQPIARRQLHARSEEHTSELQSLMRIPY